MICGDRVTLPDWPYEDGQGRWWDGSEKVCALEAGHEDEMHRDAAGALGGYAWVGDGFFEVEIYRTPDGVDVTYAPENLELPVGTEAWWYIVKARQK